MKMQNTLPVLLQTNNWTFWQTYE